MELAAAVEEDVAGRRGAATELLFLLFLFCSIQPVIEMVMMIDWVVVN